MTWNEFARLYDPTLNDEELHYLIWEWTPYPASDLKTTVKQLLSAIRMHKNKIHVCWECGLPESLGHRKTCSNYTKE